MNIHQRIGGIFIALTLLGAGCSGADSSVAEGNRAIIHLPNGKTIQVEVARTPSEQAEGLSERTSLKGGMLFCMDITKQQNFWMLGMKMPIDMVWIHGGEVRGVSANVPVREKDDWARRSSNEPVNMVLELPAGAAEGFGLEPGVMLEDTVSACG
ncbi:hypothetical protein COV06_00035 [Candidatus Uhrbacteria bacterium CG10_big_fil_rev_8_21_14_0_10_50_16]|uniref:DUF192 domain-containing protein n=1 Tax=Candidatus Uhrbacteria bacterium CG10_big_fil_rev_8_21_14_0_10_50_16 TaxID=1975039 RepID=A0A2H0RMK1_9BACT|nr:MAG: hypothetical protein COV06_00035 [Candidatus Uhrbacteria bacterium CG10_big_fil_rev_8_21_14_0_10_50_16]